MGIIDMHMHTTHSDGEYTPNELIQMAIDIGLKTITITDHDNMRGYEHIDYDRFKNKIELFHGLELTAKVDKGRLHILGYDVDKENEYFKKRIKEIRDSSFYSEMALLEQLRKDFGIMFDSIDIRNIFDSTHNIGRPDIALLLMKYGYVKSIPEAFDKFLNFSYEKTRGTNKTKSFQECIDIIRTAGGIPVLAHPNQLKMEDNELEEFLKKLICSGIEGIEVYHSGHSKEETDYYKYLANKYNLLISGGSDYHGPVVKPNVLLGKPDVYRLTLVDKLRERKK